MPQKIDDMTFTDAAEYCLELRRSLMVWRGDTYNLKDDRDIQRGIARQEGIDQENARKSGDMADAIVPIAGRMATTGDHSNLSLRRAENGGWLVQSSASDPRIMADLLGSFTNTADMLRALADLLEQDDQKREERDDE